MALCTKPKTMHGFCPERSYQYGTPNTPKASWTASSTVLSSKDSRRDSPSGISSATRDTTPRPA